VTYPLIGTDERWRRWQSWQSWQKEANPNRTRADLPHLSRTTNLKCLIPHPSSLILHLSSLVVESASEGESPRHTQKVPSASLQAQFSKLMGLTASPCLTFSLLVPIHIATWDIPALGNCDELASSWQRVAVCKALGPSSQPTSRTKEQLVESHFHPRHPAAATVCHVSDMFSSI
jgi:hypothetical protein